MDSPRSAYRNPYRPRGICSASSVRSSFALESASRPLYVTCHSALPSSIHMALVDNAKTSFATWQCTFDILPVGATRSGKSSGNRYGTILCSSSVPEWGPCNILETTPPKSGVQVRHTSPKLARNRPSSCRIRPIWGRNPQTSKTIGPGAAKIGPDSAKDWPGFYQTWHDIAQV